MNIIVCKDYKEMSAAAAKIMADVIKKKPDCILGLATGSTPIGMYDDMIEMYKSGELDFSAVQSINLDEYYPISPENDQSYRYFMNEHLFNHININKADTHVPNGLAKDADAACNEYEEMISKVGSPDIQVLGIGQNGHIGFNEPDEKLELKTHVTGLTESTIRANARFFASEAEVPTRALTMGMGTIFNAKKIIILANGKAKHDAISTVLSGKITTSCPASLLNLHSDVTVICDEEAYNG